MKIICFDSLFKSKDFFESEVDKQEQIKQKNDNFLNNNMEDVFMKRVNLEPKAISSSFSVWMSNANTLHDNYLFLDKSFQVFLDNFEHFKNIENAVKDNMFVVDLHKEAELHIRDPYKRSFDDALVARIEDNLVAIRQSQKRVKHFMDNCSSPSDYSAYRPLTF